MNQSDKTLMKHGSYESLIYPKRIDNSTHKSSVYS